MLAKMLVEMLVRFAPTLIAKYSIPFCSKLYLLYKITRPGQAILPVEAKCLIYHTLALKGLTNSLSKVFFSVVCLDLLIKMVAFKKIV